jgi:branched-subunit amino acid aminotransferase/4-amino-4-deoxychorismate lyase
MATSSALQLFAVAPEGPVELALEGAQGTVHDLLERLPGGVYSALRTFGHNRFLWLDRHLERTERSMLGMGWKRSLDRARLCSALHRVVSNYPLADSRVRFDVLEEPVDFMGVRAELFIALSPFVAVPEEFLRDGVRVEIAPDLHREAPRIKTTEFVRRRKPLPLGTKERYEHIMLDAQRRVLECSSSNIAFVRSGAIVSAGDGVLEGITALVLRHVAAQLGLRWLDERLPLAELRSVDEAFLSSSARGVVPIVDVAGERIGSGRVGGVTRRLSAAYLEFAEREARTAV